MRISDWSSDVCSSDLWKPEYDRWVRMLAGMYAGPGKEAVAWDQALASDMIFSQPVVYEFPRIRLPTTPMIGQPDRTALGRAPASPELAERLGGYPALGSPACCGRRFHHV